MNILTDKLYDYVFIFHCEDQDIAKIRRLYTEGT